MVDLDTSGSCPRPDFLSLKAYCSDSSSNNSEYCRDIDAVLFFLNVDCYITKVFYPLTGILVVVGTILNLFSLYCFLKMNKRNSQNVYLSVLSLVDTINLHINFTLPMLRRFESFDDFFRNLKFLCRFTGVLTEFFLIFPTWIVVLLTVERLICIAWPLKRRSSYTQSRAKISIVILAIIVLLLSLYRFFDLKGIDQVSVFSVAACNGTHQSITFMRNLNLMIWTIVPECLTLIMSLIIVYQIKLATQQFEHDQSKARQSKYNQATKTVLLISILFLVFNTPTGIMIALNLFYGSDGKTLGIIIILASRKVTITLYEISLCCKFFIYHRTLQNFKIMLTRSFSRFIRRTNSAKLGRPVPKNPHNGSQHQVIHFGPFKRALPSLESPSDSFIKNAEEHHSICNNRHPRTSSTSLSRTNREHQSLNVLMTKNNDGTHVVLSTASDLLQKTRRKRRTLCSTKAQITL